MNGSSISESRIRVCVDAPEEPNAQYVLYWMVAARRSRYNPALEHAACRAEALGLPLLVVEPLRLDYPWACQRFHRFLLDGMHDNLRAFSRTQVSYYPYVECVKGASKGMLPAFAKNAALVVSDDSPAFFFPAMMRSATSQLNTRFECVDSCGLYPVRATERIFTTAASFRRHLQKELPAHLAQLPERDPIDRRKLAPRMVVPASLRTRWPKAKLPLSQASLQTLPIDSSVAPVATRGGSAAAADALADFADGELANYASGRNQPHEGGQSNLSPYLHFGHISAADIFLAVVEREDWSPAMLADRATGSRLGWWGMSEGAETFLDQLITWRELGFNGATHQGDFTDYASLPGWSRASLEAHANDPRSHIYSAEELEQARTHDDIWNAAQTQLVREGKIHNYLRMLWGKKILEWSPTPELALETMIELNNKYALDGRDPNSYSGIFWILGRYDRAWGPERKIFGKVRYMSSASTARKLRLGPYLEKYSG